MKISKDEIKKIAGDEITYYRGSRYFLDNAVSNVTWSKASGRYRSVVQGKNPYTVTIQFKDSFSCTCNCPDYIKSKKPCKHVVATLLFIENYMERSGEAPKNTREKQILDILEYFSRQDFVQVYGETFDIVPIITIPAIFKGNKGNAFISLKAGGKRLYKVANLKKFLTDYRSRENITLGKEFKFIQGESRFSKKSRRILEYLMEVLEIQESAGRSAYSNIFIKSDMSITLNMLFSLLGHIGSSPFTLILDDKTYENVHFYKENPLIKFHVTAREDEIALDYDNNYSIYPLTDTGSLLYCDGNLYNPNKSFLKNYLPFYNTLGKQKEPLLFQGEDKQRFLDLVLPRLYETMEINIPDSMKNRYIDAPLKVSIYLDQTKGVIHGTLYFEYGEYRLNPLKMEVPDGIIIIRKKEKETEVAEHLEAHGFVPYKEEFLLRSEEDIYNFIVNGISSFVEKYEMYYSDSFKSITVNHTGKLTSSVRLNQELNLLELDLIFDQVPKEELKDIFRTLQLKKKYHRLRNGSFISLDSFEAKKSLEILDNLHLSCKNQTEDKFLLPKYSAVYLEEYLGSLNHVAFKESDEIKELVSEILQNKESRFKVPGKVKASLRDYQKKGYFWLKMLAGNNLGGVLADDMGLGKTLESITYITSCPDKLHLVVCPTSLVYNWQDEFSNFAPALKTLVVKGPPEVRRELIMEYKDYDVLITSYPLIRRDYEHYKEIPVHTMFIDEAQFIKNPGSQNSRAVKKIPSLHKFALTGTPIENSLTELWSIFDFIMPGFLFSHTKFVETYERPIVRDESKEVLLDLTKRIHPFILRRMKKDVLKELPDKIETKLLTEMTEKQSLVYLSYMNNIKTELSNTIKEKGYEKSSFQILSALTRLRQICCHPSTFIENYTGESGKLNLLLEQLPGILESGHRVLIFSQFTSMLGILGDHLDAQGITYFYLDGASKMDDRMDMVKRFNRGENSIFLISLKAGGTGLNLVGADTVIHYDPWWNPAVEEQATDRVYRIGQKNTVHVIKLLTKGTIEEKIYKLQKKKQALSDSVIDAREVFINRLTKDEIEELFAMPEEL